MNQLNEGRENRPRRSETAIKVVLDLIPYVGGALSTIYGDHMERRRDRVIETVEETVERSGGDPGPLLDRLRTDEEFADAFFTAVEASSETSVEAKRRAFGRILASGLSENVGELDETKLLIDALQDLDLLHLRTIQRIHTFQSDGRLRSLVAATPAPVFAVLRRHGLLDEVGTYRGGVSLEGLSEFGERLLHYVTEVGGVPPE